MAFPAPFPVPASPREGPPRPRQAQAEVSGERSDLGSQVYSGQRGEVGRGLAGGGLGGVGGLGVGVGLSKRLKVSGASCTEDASGVCWAAVNICIMGALAKVISLAPFSSLGQTLEDGAEERGWQGGRPAVGRTAVRLPGVTLVRMETGPRQRRGSGRSAARL